MAASAQLYTTDGQVLFATEPSRPADSSPNTTSYEESIQLLATMHEATLNYFTEYAAKDKAAVNDVRFEADEEGKSGSDMEDELPTKVARQ